MLFTTRHRAVDEGHADLVGQRRQRLLQRECQADALADQARQLGKYRRRRIGLVVFLVAHVRHRHQPGLRQLGEQAVNRPGAGLGQADQLTALKPPLRLAEQPAQHTLLHRREQRVGQRSRRQRCLGGAACRSHLGNDPTQIGKIRQAGLWHRGARPSGLRCRSCAGRSAIRGPSLMSVVMLRLSLRRRGRFRLRAFRRARAFPHLAGVLQRSSRRICQSRR